MRAAAESLMKLMQDPKYGGGQPGILAVLHTWGRTLNYHPHVHMVVPGVVLRCNTKVSDKKGYRKVEWRLLPNKDFLVPLEPLKEIFRALFVSMARTSLPELQFPEEIWGKKWVIYCKSVGKGAGNVFHYLSRYIFRTAISNSRILPEENGMCRFKYKGCNDLNWKIMLLRPMEFIRRFLQHIPPIGFHKVRYFGFMAPACRLTLFTLKYCLLLKFGNTLKNNLSLDLEYKRTCPVCKVGYLVVIYSIWGEKIDIFKTRPPP
jgi:hypothetical protein